MDELDSLAVGSTFLFPTGDGFHLFVVLTDHQPSKPHFLLLAPICSYIPEKKHDPTCLLRADEHPFIEHISYVKYNSFRIEPINKVLDGLNSGAFPRKEPMNSQLVSKIINGVYLTDRVPPYVKEFLESFD